MARAEAAHERDHRRGMIGTCDTCHRDDVLVVRGKLVEHTADPRAERPICRGSCAPSAEVRERARVRRVAEKQKTVDAVREDASVLLDTLLYGRTDLDTEFDVDHFRKLAAVKYALITGHRMRINASNWMSGPERHRVFCAYCGYHFVSIPNSYWSILTVAEKVWLLGRHTTICALQVLAGIRDPAPHAARYEDPTHEPLFRATYVEPDLSKPCVECDAPYGLPCYSVDAPTPGREAYGSRLRRRKRTHACRRAAKTTLKKLKNTR